MASKYWRCTCGARNTSGSEQCRDCGYARPERILKVVPSPASQPLEALYPHPATPEEAKAAIAQIKALLADRMTVDSRRREKDPDVDADF